MKITWETRDAGTAWGKTPRGVITPATSEGGGHGLLSNRGFCQSRAVSYETEEGCWDPQVEPGLPVPGHTPTLLNSTRHFLKAQILKDTKIDLMAFFVTQIVNRSISFQVSSCCHSFWKW